MSGEGDPWVPTPEVAPPATFPTLAPLIYRPATCASFQVCALTPLLFLWFLSQEEGASLYHSQFSGIKNGGWLWELGGLEQSPGVAEVEGRGWQGFPSSAPPMPAEAGPGQETCYCVSLCPDTAFTDGETKARGASAGHPVPVLSSQGVDLGVDPWGSLTQTTLDYHLLYTVTVIMR